MLIESRGSSGGDDDGSDGTRDANVVTGRNANTGNSGRGGNGGGDNGRHYGNSHGSNVEDSNAIYGCDNSDSGVKW